MKNSEIRKFRRVGCYQQDIADCGVACLTTIFRFYGTDMSLEYCRQLSGTNAQGTTMYGLVLASQAIGFTADGYSMEFEKLCAMQSPVIVHTHMPSGLMHFMVFCREHKGFVTLFDPSRGIVSMPDSQFIQMWTGKALIVAPSSATNFKMAMPVNRMLQFLASTVRSNKATFAGLVILSLVIALVGMATSVFFQKLIDDFLPAKVWTSVMMGIVIVAILTLVKIFFAAVKQSVVVRLYKDVLQDVVKRFLCKLFSLKLSFFESRRIGDLSARLSDVRRIQSIVGYVIGGDMLVDVFVILVGVVMAGMFAWPVPLIVLAVLGVSTAYVAFRNDSIVARQREMMASYSRLESSFINSVKNVRMLKVNGLSHSVALANNQLYLSYTDKELATSRLQIRMSLFFGVVSAVLLCATMSTCALMFFHGEALSMGQFISVVSIVSVISPSVVSLSLLPITYNDAKIAFDRFLGTIDMPSESDEGCECPSIQSINIRDLSFSFIGRRPLIRNLSANLVMGKINCLVGKSGSGKSTLCKLLDKSYSVSGDSILVNDTLTLNSIRTADFQRHVGIVPQEIIMTEGTVLDNICAGLEGAPQDVYRQAVQFCQSSPLAPFLAELPNGLATVVGEAGVSLSGGEKQLVAMTRILLRNPEIFILDEATSAMDAQLRDCVWEILDSLSSSRLIIVVTHQSALLDRIAANINYVHFS